MTAASSPRASGRRKTDLHRSPSVEYEKETQTISTNRRSRGGAHSAKPLSSASTHPLLDLEDKQEPLQPAVGREVRSVWHVQSNGERKVHAAHERNRRDKRKDSRRAIESDVVDEEESVEKGKLSHGGFVNEQPTRALLSSLSDPVPPPGIGNNALRVEDDDSGLERLREILDSIIEEDEPAALSRSAQVPSSWMFSIGVMVGLGVRAVFSFILELGKYATIALGLHVAWSVLISGRLMLSPRLLSPLSIHPPNNIPSTENAEVSARLLRMENALASLSVDTARLHELEEQVHTVEGAVVELSKLSKDTLAWPDFALHSGGANVIPTLTSDTFKMEPQGLLSLLSNLFDDPPVYGHPSVTALTHETHVGHCWPFPGTQGQLGVLLPVPVHITDVTVDHVAKEVATDMRMAPRRMELWGRIDGNENLAKYRAWKAQHAEAHAFTERAGEEHAAPEEDYPKTLPRSLLHVKIAEFMYNIYAPQHVQTFAVPQEVRELGVDFRAVVLFVKDNWGREDFTCLYRFRVHGEQRGGMPETLPEDFAS